MSELVDNNKNNHNKNSNNDNNSSNKDESHAIEYVDKDFSEVILTGGEVILPTQTILSTPSMAHGLTFEEEWTLRIHATQRMYTAGLLLQLSMTSVASAHLLFHRFFYRRSLVDYDTEQVGTAALNVFFRLEKSSERDSRMRNVINVYNHMKQVYEGRTIRPMRPDINYANYKNHIVKIEFTLLRELGFCTTFKHPHKLVMTLCRSLKLNERPNFVQIAINYLNDSYHTDVHLRFPYEVVACACIYLASIAFNISMATEPPWYVLFGVTRPDIEAVAKSILSLYSRPKIDLADIKDKIKLIKAARIPVTTTPQINPESTPVAQIQHKTSLEKAQEILSKLSEDGKKMDEKKEEKIKSNNDNDDDEDDRKKKKRKRSNSNRRRRDERDRRRSRSRSVKRYKNESSPERDRYRRDDRRDYERNRDCKERDSRYERRDSHHYYDDSPYKSGDHGYRKRDSRYKGHDSRYDERDSSHYRDKNYRR